LDTLKTAANILRLADLIRFYGILATLENKIGLGSWLYNTRRHVTRGHHGTCTGWPTESIFFGEHDCDHPAGDGRISGIIGTGLRKGKSLDPNVEALKPSEVMTNSLSPRY